jgi:zinc protease
MSTLDRSRQPDILPINALATLETRKIELQNGIPLYVVSGGEQDIFKLEIVFNAGSAFGNNALTSAITNKLLIEGTTTKTSGEISEAFDFHGAILNKYCDKDFAGLSVFSLNKYAPKILPLFAEILSDPIFPEEEFQTLIKKQEQFFLVNNQKVSHLAKENFFPLVFGKEHPYGKMTKIEDYENIGLESIKTFYQKYYHSKNCILIVSGKVTDELLKTIGAHIGTMQLGQADQIAVLPELENIPAYQEIIKREEVLQSAIRIGRPTINKLHPDYIPMKLVSTILGGYFGSRLMANVREDKGFTYGIGSNIVSLKQGGYFFISTEVGAEVSERALKEIYFEVARMRNEKVPEAELSLVKNYMIGSFMHSIDGPFGMSENFKHALLFGLDANYLHQIVDTVNAMTANDVQAIANKYLQQENLFELIVGK